MDQVQDAMQRETEQAQAVMRNAEFHVRDVALVILTILAVLYTLYFAADIILPFVLALVLSLLLSPATRFLCNRLRLPRMGGGGDHDRVVVFGDRRDRVCGFRAGAWLDCEGAAEPAGAAEKAEFPAPSDHDVRGRDAADAASDAAIGARPGKWGRAERGRYRGQTGACAGRSVGLVRLAGGRRGIKPAGWHAQLSGPGADADDNVVFSAGGWGRAVAPLCGNPAGSFREETRGEHRHRG